MRRGEWPNTLSHRLAGSTLGIMGLGAIGSLVARAGAGLGMEVLVWGQARSAARAALVAKSCAALSACSAAPRIRRSRALALGVGDEPRLLDAVVVATTLEAADQPIMDECQRLQVFAGLL